MGPVGVPPMYDSASVASEHHPRNIPKSEVGRTTNLRQDERGGTVLGEMEWLQHFWRREMDDETECDGFYHLSW